MTKISISELEALRAKMTDGTWWLDETDLDAEDINGLCAEHNAMPALLAAIKAALAYRDAVQSRPGRRYRNGVEDAERELYAAIEAVTL